VYTVEQGPIIAAAKLICRHNGFQDRVRFINDWSDKIDLPEKIDLIIIETVGNLAFEEGILGWITDAKKRFLEKGGQIIPKTLELVILYLSNALNMTIIFISGREKSIPLIIPPYLI